MWRSADVKYSVPSLLSHWNYRGVCLCLCPAYMFVILTTRVEKLMNKSVIIFKNDPHFFFQISDGLTETSSDASFHFSSFTFTTSSFVNAQDSFLLLTTKPQTCQAHANTAAFVCPGNLLKLDVTRTSGNGCLMRINIRVLAIHENCPFGVN